jgi:hypothetical protein
MKASSEQQVKPHRTESLDDSAQEPFVNALNKTTGRYRESLHIVRGYNAIEAYFYRFPMVDTLFGYDSHS